MIFTFTTVEGAEYRDYSVLDSILLIDTTTIKKERFIVNTKRVSIDSNILSLSIDYYKEGYAWPYMQIEEFFFVNNSVKSKFILKKNKRHRRSHLTEYYETGEIREVNKMRGKKVKGPGAGESFSWTLRSTTIKKTYSKSGQLTSKTIIKIPRNRKF